MKELYFDYAATTPLCSEAMDAMRPYMQGSFANPSSAHKAGQAALAALDRARETIAGLLDIENEKDIIFTSCATESNNMIIKGIAHEYFFQYKKPAHIMSSSIDHPSVVETLCDLEKQKIAEITLVDPDERGYIDPQKIIDEIKENTIFISIHYVNSETGNRQPIAEIVKAVKEKSKQCFMHTDASQALPSEPVSIKQLGVDALTLSAHKIYGPKGAALLYKNPAMHIARLISGSDQEGGLRAGTENVPAIVGFCRALEVAAAKQEETKENFLTLRSYFIEELKSQHIRYEVNGGQDIQSPKIISLFLPSKIAQEVLIFLDSKNISISAGSACKAHAPIPSESVYRMYGDHMRALHSISISFGYKTSKSGIRMLVQALKEII